MNLADLAAPAKGYSYAFLDEFAKREIRRRLLKAVAIPGYQVPYASREVPIARGWGTGGLQVTLSLVGPDDTVKVIDQGADDSVNAVNLRRFIARMSAAATTTDTQLASLIQSRHRVPEERLTGKQILILQVPYPEPLRNVQPDIDKAREMHALADYGLMWLNLYEQLVRHRRYTDGADYPVLVNGRHVMAPSPIPRWDNPKLHRAEHLTLLSAGREKRMYAVPPFTDVRPLEFDDVPFSVEEAPEACHVSGVKHMFLNEIPLPDGASRFEVSDTDALDKLTHEKPLGPTFYDGEGNFYHVGFLASAGGRL